MIAKEGKSFLMVVGYYKWFIEGSTKLTQLLKELTHRDVHLRWLMLTSRVSRNLKRSQQ